MTAAASNAVRVSDPVGAPSRGIRLFRVFTLLIAGFTIAFTATEHQNLGFDLTVAAVSLAVIGMVHLAEWVAARGRTPVALLLGVTSVLAAILLPVTGSLLGFAVAIAGWALVSALLEFIGAATRPGSRQDATLLGALGMILSVCVLLVRDDQVAILGFFGGYAVVAGVFLGISAFDTKRTTSNAPVETPASAQTASLQASEQS